MTIGRFLTVNQRERRGTNRGVLRDDDSLLRLNQSIETVGGCSFVSFYMRSMLYILRSSTSSGDLERRTR